MKKIAVIGDSHARDPFYQLFPEIVSGIRRIGPVLCYSVAQNPERFEINEIQQVLPILDYLVFSFGEIDCRCQVIKRNPTLELQQNNISDIVHNYFISILEVMEKYPNIRPVVYNVIPPVSIEKMTIKNAASMILIIHLSALMKIG